MHDAATGAGTGDGAGAGSGAGGPEDLAVDEAGLQSLQAKDRDVREVVDAATRHADTATTAAHGEMSARSMRLAESLRETREIWSNRRRTLVDELDRFHDNIGFANTVFTTLENSLGRSFHGISEAAQSSARQAVEGRDGP